MNSIVCTDAAFGIGINNKLLLVIPEDMHRFRALTLHKTVVMGYNTMLSLPGAAPLAQRTNIVLSRTRTPTHPGFTLCRSLDEFFSTPAAHKPEDIFIIGGAQIYALFYPYCTKAYVTRLDARFDADSFFPNIAADKDWTLTKTSPTHCHQGIRYSFLEYARIR